MAENTNTERDRAIMEGERNASLEAYRRGAWPCTAAMERSYEAGFTNGWERRASLSLPAAGQEPVARVNDDGFIVETGLLLSPGMKLYAAPQAPEGGPPGSGGWQSHAEDMERQRDYWRQRAKLMFEHQDGVCWYWQGDGSDYPESLVNSLPVVIRADQLRELLAAPQPAVAAGWVMVPADPTLDMGWAYLDAARESEPFKSHSFNHDGYRAMLKAAPLPPAPSTEGEGNG